MVFLNQYFGESDPVRLESQCDYMIGIGCNVEFKLYPNVGHQLTSNMIEDVFEFFDRQRNFSSEPIAMPWIPLLLLNE
jgi:hypothetical protein